MPSININGGSGAGSGGGSYQGTRSYDVPVTTSERAAASKNPFFKLSPDESSAAAMRIRKTLVQNERRLYDQAFKAEKQLQDQKLRSEKEQLRREQSEQRKLQNDRSRADKDYSRWWSQELKNKETSERRQQSHEESQKRTRDRKLARAARFGAILGSLGQGDIGGIVGGLGGAAGAVIGEALGGPIGEIIGAEIGKSLKYIVNPVGDIARSAAPAIDIQRQIYGLGRAGNFAGLGLYNAIRPGERSAAPWMQALGITSQEAIGSIAAFGGAGIARNNPLGLAQTLQSYAASPAFSALPGGTVEGLARQGVGLGAAGASTGGIDNFLSRFAPLLETAMAKGMDQSQLLSSLQGSMDSLARAGAVGGISTGSLLDLTSRLAAGGTPGGRTGSTASDIAAGVSGITGDVTKNPYVFSLLMSQMGSYGGLKTAKDVEKFVGHGGLDPTMVKRITDAANAGNPTVALQMATALTQGDPERLGQLVAPAAGLATGGQSYLTPSFLAATTGTDIAHGMALDASQNLPAPSTTSRTSTFMKGLSRINPNGTPNLNLTEQDLIKRGVRPDLAGLFVAEQKQTGTPALVLATIAAMESGGGSYKNINTNLGTHPGRNKNGTTDYGIMGINSSSPYFESAVSGLGGNVAAGGNIFQDKLKAAHGDYQEALRMYNGSGPAAQAYGAKAFAMMGGTPQGGGPDLNLPSLANQTRANGAQGDLFAANEGLKLIGPTANKAAGALDDLTDAARRFVRWFDSASPSRSGAIHP